MIKFLSKAALISLIFCMQLPVLANSNEMQMADFSFGTQLTVSEAPIRRFEFKPDMVRNVLRRDLGDIRVYDSSNELISVQVNKLNSDIIYKRTRLAFLSSKDKNNKVQAYIIDRTADHKRWLESLQLNWKQTLANSAVIVNVEQSDDLKLWKKLKSNVVASSFRFGEDIIDHNFVEINDFTQRYIKITFSRKRYIQPLLTSVHAVSTNEKPLQLNWIKVSQLSPVKGKSNQYRFNIDSGIAPNNIKLDFSALNSSLHGSLYAIVNIDGKEHKEKVSNEFDHYKLTLNRQIVRSKPFNISRWKAREWIVEVSEGSKFDRKNPPSVLAEYPAYEITFPHLGKDPYTLVWGNEKADAPESHPTWPEDKAEKVNHTRILGKAELTELMESQETPWIAILISLVLLIIAGVGGFIGFKRYKKSKE